MSLREDHFVTTMTVASGDAGSRITPTAIWDDGRVLPQVSIEKLGLESLTRNGNELEDLGRFLKHFLTSNEEALPDEHRVAVRAVDRWVEVAELLRAIGTAAGLASVGVTETHRFVLASELAGADRSRRHADLARAGFLAEGTQQYLISIGHQLTALGLRIAILNRATPAVGSKRFLRMTQAIIEGNGSPKAWPYHSDAGWLMEELDGSTPKKATEVLRRAAALHGTEEWRLLDSTRGTNFHRLRVDLTAANAAAQRAARELHGQALEAATELGRYLGPVFHAALRSLPTLDDGTGGQVPMLKPVYGEVGLERYRPPDRLTPKRRPRFTA